MKIDDARVDGDDLDLEDHICQEGGWQKPVAPPLSAARPSGLPPIAPASTTNDDKDSKKP